MGLLETNVMSCLVVYLKVLQDRTVWACLRQCHELSGCVFEGVTR